MDTVAESAGLSINVSILEQLSKYRHQLDLAKELIKILEQQKTIYRDLLNECKCSTKDNSDIRLQDLDSELSKIYPQCKFFECSSEKEQQQPQLITTPSTTIKPLTMLGIDVKTLLNEKRKNQEHSKTIDGDYVSEVQTSKRKFFRTRTKIRCSIGKCRYTTISKKNIIKHRIDEHRRKEFLSIIEPFGFGLNEDNSKVISFKDHFTCIERCCFPFCRHEFSNNDNVEDVQDKNQLLQPYIEHFESHLPTYIFQPCYNCLEMFATKSKLDEHLQIKTKCKKYYEFERDKLKSKKDSLTNEIQKDEMFKCKLCCSSSKEDETSLDHNARYYTNRQLFQLHVNMFHPGNDANDLEIKIPVFENNITNNDEKSDSDSTSQIIEESTVFGNSSNEKIPIYDELSIIDYIFSDSTSKTVSNTKSDSPLLMNPDNLINSNIGLEVFIDDDNAEDLNNSGISNAGEFSSTSQKSPPTSPVEEDNNQLSDYVFNNNVYVVDDHTYINIINEENSSGLEPNELEKDSNQHKSTDDHEDYTNKSLEVIIPELKQSKQDNVEECKDDSEQLKQLMNIYIYECSLCTYSFRSEQELSKHNYLAHKIISYHCKMCDFVTQDTGKFHRHESLFHNNKQNLDSNAQSTLTDQEKQQVSVQSLFLCRICSESFVSDVDLRTHQIQNHESKECEICHLMINGGRHHFQSHMLSFHREAVHKCEVCSYKTYNKQLFDVHVQRHQRCHPCPFEGCSDMFGKQARLEAHINRFHKNIQPHECEHCQRKFYSEDLLEKHLIAQHNHFLYRCDQCDFKSNNQRNYNQHLQSHSVDKPFECNRPNCNSKFRTKKLLQAHFRNKHSQLKPFKCSACNKWFKTRAQLQKHEKIHSKNLPQTKIKQNNNKTSNIQYYVFEDATTTAASSENDKTTGQSKSIIIQPPLNKSNISSIRISQTSSSSNQRSLMIKPSLLRPSNSVSSGSMAILTTMITPVDNNDDIDDNGDGQQ